MLRRRFFVQQDAMESGPKGYGVCWRVPDMHAYLICPIPFNVVLRLLRGAWTWLSFPFPFRSCTRWERLEDRAGAAEQREVLLKGEVSGLEWEVARLRAVVKRKV